MFREQLIVSPDHASCPAARTLHGRRVARPANSLPLCLSVQRPMLRSPRVPRFRLSAQQLTEPISLVAFCRILRTSAYRAPSSVGRRKSLPCTSPPPASSRTGVRVREKTFRRGAAAALLRCGRSCVGAGTPSTPPTTSAADLRTLGCFWGSAGVHFQSLPLQGPWSPARGAEVRSRCGLASRGSCLLSFLVWLTSRLFSASLRRWSGDVARF